jgi:hypothetical protein
MTTSTLQCSPFWFHFHCPIRKLDLAASCDKEARLDTQNDLFFNLLNKKHLYKNFVSLNSTSCTVQRKRRFSSTGTPIQYQYGCTEKRSTLIFNKESLFLRLYSKRKIYKFVFTVVIFVDFYTFRNWYYLILQNQLSA